MENVKSKLVYQMDLCFFMVYETFDHDKTVLFK